MPYDLVVDLGEKFLKIQVKTTEKKRLIKKLPIYTFKLKMGGKKKRQRLLEKDVDFFAFVALDILTVAYLPSKTLLINKKIQHSINFQTKDIKSQNKNTKYIEDYKKLII